MKYYISSTQAIFVAMVISVYPTIALSSGEYTFMPGDCLSGVVSAHYPKSTGYSFVLNVNPHIVDASNIAVGTRIKLPGLTQRQINTAQASTRCNSTYRKMTKADTRERSVSEHDTTTAQFLKALEKWKIWAEKTDNTIVLNRIKHIDELRKDEGELVLLDEHVVNAIQVVHITEKPRLPLPVFSVDQLNTVPIRRDAERSDKYVVNAIGADNNSHVASIKQSNDASFNIVRGITNNDDLLIPAISEIGKW